MIKKIIGCGLVIAAGATFAQQGSVPKPGPEYKLISYFEGKWTTELESKLGSGGKIKTSTKCDWFAGGFQLVCKSDVAASSGSATSMGIVSYSPLEKAYMYYLIDSAGSAVLLSKGKKNGSTWTFSYDFKQNGASAYLRYTVVELSATEFSQKWETSADGSKWVVMNEAKSVKTG